MFHKIAGEKGSILFAVAAMLTLAFLAVAMVSLFTSTVSVSSAGFSGIKAFYLAQSGKEIAMTECIAKGTCQSSEYKIGNGTAKVTLISVVPLYKGNYVNSKNDILNVYNGLTLVYTMTSEGIYGNSRREIEYKFWRTANGTE